MTGCLADGAVSAFRTKTMESRRGPNRSRSSSGGVVFESTGNQPLLQADALRRSNLVSDDLESQANQMSRSADAAGFFHVNFAEGDPNERNVVVATL